MDIPEPLHRIHKLKFKRALRKHMTPAEEILWQELRNRKLNGMKWRRQTNVDAFIADFLCHEYRLIVEIDGGIHEEQEEYDLLRTEIIEHRKFRVIRFKNEEVLHALPTVLQRIHEACTSKTQAPSSLLASGEEVGR